MIGLSALRSPAILLGTKAQRDGSTVVAVNGFVPSTGDPGPVMDLYPGRVAGFYSPGPEDLTLLERYPLSFLLVRSREAGDRADVVLRGGTRGHLRLPAPHPRRPRLTAVATIALLLAGLFAGPAWTVRPPETAPVVPAPTPQPLGLRATRDGSAILLTWDHDAPAVRDASEGAIAIRDGDHDSNFSLDSGQLAAGSLTYYPVGPEVSFRLDVKGPFGAGTELLRVMGPSKQTSVSASKAAVAAPPPPEPAPQPSTPEPDPEVVAKATPPSAPVTAAEPSEQRPSPFSTPRESLERAGSADRSAPPRTLSQPKVETRVPTGPAITPPPKTVAAEPPPEPVIAVSAEPVASGSRIRKMVRRIPLVGRLGKSPKSFVPPKPLSEVRPVLSARERKAVTTTVPVNLRVYVTDSGKVEYAELTDEFEPAHKELVTAAISAARRWKFAPARVGDDPVPGEVILRFRFSPPAIAASR